MQRVTILQQVQNQRRCQRVEDLGAAREDPDVHRQERTPLPSIRRQPCGSHVPVDTKKAGRDHHVHQRGRGLPGVDRLLACSSTNQSIQMSESKRPTRMDNPMDVDALSKGSGKGKSKGKSMKGKSKSKGKSEGTLNNAESSILERKIAEKRLSILEQGDEHVDGCIWSGQQGDDGWWKTTDWLKKIGSGWWMTANDQKKRQTVISTEQTKVRTVLPPEVPHDTRICLTLSEKKRSRDWSVERGKRSARRECRHRTWKTCTHEQMKCADEIICSHLGRGSIQVGNTCWKLLNLEQGMQLGEQWRDADT